MWLLSFCQENSDDLFFKCFLFPLDMQMVELCCSAVDRPGVLYPEASEIVRFYLVSMSTDDFTSGRPGRM